MRRALALAGAAALALAAAAVPPEFHRWQFGEFAATLRYLQHGVATPGINDIYAREIGGFVAAERARVAILQPAATLGTLDGSWVFFGARFLPLPAAAGAPSFYALSYLGAASAFHGGKSYDALVTAAEVRGAVGARPVAVRELGAASAQVAQRGHAPLSRNGHYAPLSWNSLDLDGDGRGDFTLGGMLHLSSRNYREPLAPAGGAASEAVFLRTARAPRVAFLQGGRLSLQHLEALALREEAALELPDVAENAGHALVALPAGAGDRIAVRTACGLQLVEVHGGELRKGACITGLEGRWALPGARGDFDRDGHEDFWLSQPMLGIPVAQARDHVRLISGARLAQAAGEVHVDRLTLARVNGSPRFTDHDGIATTLSPVAGDLDGDGRPDLTFTGHRHMNEAGALYVLLGRDVKPGLTLDIADARIVKLAGPLMSQLAPPYHHWDATDWDGDGRHDIVVSADNDLLAGLNAGAIYVISGARLLREWRRKSLANAQHRPR